MERRNHLTGAGKTKISKLGNRTSLVRKGNTIVVMVVITIIMVVLGYLGIMKMIELAEKSGEEQLANSGGAPLKAFVDGDVEGMQAAIAKNANEEFLYESVAQNNIDDVASALAAGGNVNMINTAGATLLHRAAANGSLEIAEILIEYGAKVDTQTKRGMTPLHIAVNAKKPNIDVVVLLLEEWADTDIQDNNGDTPLHIAARKGNLEIVKLIVEYRADLNIKNKDRKRPLSVALAAEQTKIAELLRENGAKE
jgi:ankyrin repeat protein